MLGFDLQRGAALAALFLSAALLHGCGGDSTITAPAIAITADGPVTAVDRTGMRSYFAIPYAAPPTGALRWREPAAAARWTVPIARTASANTCPQAGGTFGINSTNEDCLYLDVHAPTGPGPFPVMVWFHGGAFLTGGAVTYADPTPLVSRGVVVVAVNYRLGAMGIFAHPALSAEQGGASGNYGIMDQQAALRWVQTNIAAFAGDPKNVTAFGESAGGFSTFVHLVSPGSRDLFHKAIIQSGAYPFDRQFTLAQAEANGTTVVTNTLAAAGVGVTCSTQNAACLRSLPVAQLLTAYGAQNASPVPNVDGRVLTKSVKAAFAAGENIRVPVIQGTNRDEYGLFVAIGELTRRGTNTTPGTQFALTAAAYSANAAGLAAGTGVATATLTGTAYPLANYGSDPVLQPSLATTALGTDVVFVCPALKATRRIASQGTATYAYEFRDRTAIPSIGRTILSFSQGAYHSAELQYIFNFRDQENEARRTLGGTMAAYWTNFAKTGDPNGAGLPTWARFAANAEVVQGLDLGATGVAPVPTFVADHKCDTTWSVLTF